MQAIDVYMKYMAIKMHFTPGNSYNYFRYNGRVGTSVRSFEKRRDKFMFEKLGRKFGNSPSSYSRDFILANLYEDPSRWVRDLIGDEAEERYAKWLKYQASLEYNFKQEIAAIAERRDYYRENFDLLFSPEISGQDPPLLTFFHERAISIETLIGFDAVFGCFEWWDKKIEDPIIWPSLFERCKKYRPFIEIDPVRHRQCLVKEFL